MTRFLRSIALAITLAFAIPHALADASPPTLDALPAPVQETAREHVRDGHVTEIEHEMEDGLQIYEIEFMRDGQAYEMKIDQTGNLLELEKD